MKLKSLEVTNFRSIRGTILADMDASVILIHGANGAGKTSLMSAIELGLTGDVSALVGFGDEYGDHLLHSETTRGGIELSLADGRHSTAAFGVDQTDRPYEGVLSERDSEFLRERAYLAQSTMARLLEAYEQSDRRGDSALTRFVNELLGLDELDALIAGLEPARDVRRARKLVPELQDLGDEVRHLESRLKQTQTELSAATDRSKSLSKELDGLPAVEHSKFATSLLAAAISRLDMVLARLDQLRSSTMADSIEVEARLREASDRVVRWRDNSEAAFRALLDESIAFTNSDIQLSAEPNAISVSLNLAEDLVARALEDATARLAAHNLGGARLVPLREQIEVAGQALARMNEEIAEVATSSDAGRLAEALSLLVPHVDTNECPVCGRMFDEVRDEPLSQHLANRVAALGAVARRIESLGARRSEQRNHLERLTRERDRIEGTLEAKSVVEALTSTVAAGNNLIARISGSRSGARSVEEVLERRRKLEAMMSESAAASETLEELRGELARIESEFAVGLGRSSKESFRERVSGTREELDGIRLASEKAAQAGEYRRSLQSDLADAEEAVGEATSRLGSLKERLENAKARLRNGSRRVELAAHLSKKAVALRSEIVEKVFDSTLNGTWRDLFTRLAPEEPFIPEFIASGGSVSGVRLQAVHKRTKAAGAPGLVLSAGNLNTAALTLFLSLNATATSDVDVLLLDDPVQAMDDIHIAQFSALMRSFTRDLGKQVVVAVHERALFEYLALELAPTNRGDALVTIELERGSGVDTHAHVSRLEFQPDPLEAGLTAA